MEKKKQTKKVKLKSKVISDTQLDRHLNILKTEYERCWENHRKVKEQTNWILAAYTLLLIFFLQFLNSNQGVSLIEDKKLSDNDIPFVLDIFVKMSIVILAFIVCIFILTRIFQPTLNLDYISKDKMNEKGTLEIIKHYKDRCIRYNRDAKIFSIMFEVLLITFYLFVGIVISAAIAVIS